MGFGVFRRRPDYERRPRRLPLTVAAAAAVGPALFVRPQAQEPPRYNYEIQRQARQGLALGVAAPAPVVPAALRPYPRPSIVPAIREEHLRRRPAVFGAAAPAPVVPAALRPYPRLPIAPLARGEELRRTTAVLGVAAPAPSVPSALRPYPRLADVPLARGEHLRRPRAMLGVEVVAPSVRPALRLRPVSLPLPPLRFEPYRRIPKYPSVEPAPIPPGAQLVQHPRRPYFSSFVRPWDYLRGTGKWRRRIIEPDHPDLEPPPLPTRGWYDDIRGHYHSGRELPANEPWGRYTGGTSISIASGSWVQVDMTATFNESGGGSSADPWGLLRPDGRLSIKRNGYYVVTADVDFGPATSGGVRILAAAVRFRLILSDGTEQRVFLTDREIPDNSTGSQEVIFSATSRPTPLIPGATISMDVRILTDTGGARDLETNTFGLYRIHGTEPIGPTY